FGHPKGLRRHKRISRDREREADAFSHGPPVHSARVADLARGHQFGSMRFLRSRGAGTGAARVALWSLEMIAGFARTRLIPPPRFDPQGYAARDRAVTEVDPNLSVTVGVLIGARGVAVIASADALAHTPVAARAIRSRIAGEIGR